MGLVQHNREVAPPAWNISFELTNLNFADDETPAGTISGTDGTDGLAAFTLAYAPSPAASLELIKTDVGTGVVMVAGVHFNLSGSTITYTTGNIPIVGMTHRASYRRA